MFENKYGKFLTILLIVGIIIVIGVLIFLGINLIRNSSIETDAGDAVDRFQEGKTNTQENEQVENTIANVVAPNVDIENLVQENTTGGEGNSEHQATYKGSPMVGTIEIPKTNVKYPVLQEASKNAIEVAVALYYGPGLNQVGNTVIVGHNYRNGTFFSNNKKLEEGDKIYVTDEKGTKVTYTIYKTYTTSPEDSDYLERDTQGKREISLLTCTDDTKSRLIIWARAD
ncbi:MAG: sortase [Clostridia bacterium]